jgi:DNA-3-methyladenine glycosylase
MTRPVAIGPRIPRAAPGADPDRGPPREDTQRPRPLPRSWYTRDVHAVARDLLGTLVVRELAGRLLIGRIVEVEAYDGPHDRASHARVGLTARTAPMFGQPGHAYVYLVYGVHHCLNVVAHPEKRASAVLVRAFEPLAGFPGGGERQASGPGLVGRALSLDRGLSGHDLTLGRELWLAEGRAVADGEVVTGPRIGVGYAGPGWAERPWRSAVRSSSALSRPFPRTGTTEGRP